MSTPKDISAEHIKKVASDMDADRTTHVLIPVDITPSYLNAIRAALYAGHGPTEIYGQIVQVARGSQ